MRQKTQLQQLREDLENGRSVTALDALKRYGSFRLAARISDLRSAGMPIKTEIVETREGARIAKYFIEYTDRKHLSRGKHLAR